MTLTEKGNSTIHSVGETPGEKVHLRHNNKDAGSNGGNVNQLKQTRVEVSSNSADQLLWRCPQCSYTNNEDNYFLPYNNHFGCNKLKQSLCFY